jgi:hypothetical protein
MPGNFTKIAACNPYLIAQTAWENLPRGQKTSLTGFAISMVDGAPLPAALDPDVAGAQPLSQCQQGRRLPGSVLDAIWAQYGFAPGWAEKLVDKLRGHFRPPPLS